MIEGLRGNIALGAGIVTGVIEHVPGVGALRLRGRGWWQVSAAQLSLTTEATRLVGAWYTDVVGGFAFDGARTVGSLWVSGRFSPTSGSTAAASASLQYFLTPSIAVEASGGNYLRDPFQGLPQAGVVGGAVRLFTVGRAGLMARAPLQPVLQPLVVADRRADTVRAGFRMGAGRA